MSTITYSEARQRVLFKAARDMREVAASYLDDMTNDVELTSENSLRWAKSGAAATARLAASLEEQGYAQCVTDKRIDNLQYASRRKYDASIDAFEARIRAAGGTVPAGSVHAELNNLGA
jgi:hypothetical protein